MSTETTQEPRYTVRFFTLCDGPRDEQTNEARNITEEQVSDLLESYYDSLAESKAFQFASSAGEVHLPYFLLKHTYARIWRLQ